MPVALSGLLATLAVAGLIACAAAEHSSTPAPAEPSGTRFYLGTADDGGHAPGIYRFALDEDGGLRNLGRVGEASQPTFLAYGADSTTLLAAEELPGGRVASFGVSPDTLTRISTRATHGGAPCHVAADPGGLVAVANYGGGNVALYRQAPDGTLSEALDVHDHRRAPGDTAHAHSVAFVDAGRGLLSADLGVDAVFRYELTGDSLAVSPPAIVELPTGVGPRHLAVAAEEDRYYVVNERGSSVALVRGLGADRPEVLGLYPTLPEERRGVENYCSHVALSEDGRHLYAANRGDNSLAVFAVDVATGALTPVQYVGVRGDWPRHFALSPEGRYLVVANQRSGNLSVFARDQASGELRFVGMGAAPTPMCVLF